MAGAIDEKSVFLNVPFDKGYEPLFVTLVGTLVCLGQKPRCVLEIRETGRGRLDRLYDLLSSCRLSIHDLSRVGSPPRFNMPFELGIAYGLTHTNPSYQLIVLDAVPFRLDTVLSDYKGRDPLIHNNRCDRLVNCLLDLLISRKPSPYPSHLRQLTRLLRAFGREIRKEFDVGDLFRPAPFHKLVSIAVELATMEGLIRE